MQHAAEQAIQVLFCPRCTAFFCPQCGQTRPEQTKGGKSKPSLCWPSKAASGYGEETESDGTQSVLSEWSTIPPSGAQACATGSELPDAEDQGETGCRDVTPSNRSYVCSAPPLEVAWSANTGGHGCGQSVLQHRHKLDCTRLSKHRTPQATTRNTWKHSGATAR